MFYTWKFSFLTKAKLNPLYFEVKSSYFIPTDWSELSWTLIDNEKHQTLDCHTRRNGNKEKTADKHLRVIIGLIRGIPAEIRADIFTTLKAPHIPHHTQLVSLSFA